VDKLRPYLVKGIPEFRIPPYDPLMIPKVSLTQGEGPVSFKSEFHNMKTYGAKDVVVKQVEVDLKNLVVTLRLFFPKLRILSTYEVDGRILVVPVQGRGKSDGNFSEYLHQKYIHQLSHFAKYSAYVCSFLNIRVIYYLHNH